MNLTRNMPPSAIVLYGLNDAAGNAKAFSQSCVTGASCNVDDFLHLCLGQNSPSVLFTANPLETTFLQGIRDVFLLCTKKKVRRIAARLEIAFVHDVKAFVKGPVRQQVGNSVSRSNVLSSDGKNTVIICFPLVTPRCPRPTLIRSALVHFWPESFRNWFRLWAGFGRHKQLLTELIQLSTSNTREA